MRLINLKLENFKGIKHFEFNTNGNSLSIYGDNATGKTTIADAQCWLLFDKDSKGTKGFCPKPKDKNGDDLHNLETYVEALYQLESGSISLKKVFSEVWKKKRGSPASEFSGHTTDYYIDGVPVKANEYIDRLNLIADINKLMMLSLPSCFAEDIPMSARRETLLDMVGDISDYAVIDSNTELTDLRELLYKPMCPNQYYSVSEYHKIAKARLAEINNELKLIPARIDEAQKAMPEEFQGDELEREIALLTIEKQKLTDKLNSSQSEKLSDIRQQIAELKVNLLEKESEHRKKYSSINANINEQINAVVSKKNVSQVTIDHAISNYKRLEIELQNLKSEREQLLKDYDTVIKSEWTGDALCPTCGQPIPEEQIQTAKEQFNLNKSKKLEGINLKGKSTCSREMIAAMEKRISDCGEKIDCEKAKIDGYLSEIEVLENKLQIAPMFAETEESAKLNHEISDLQSQMDTIKNTESTVQKDLQTQINEIDSNINECLNKRSKLELIKVQKERIAELEKQEKELGKEYEETSKGLYLCELFIRIKVSMLTDSINSKFTSVKFKLFETQINGGVKETCEVLVPCVNGLVPYQYANNAARINAGLDIIRVLSEHYGVKMPIFVDNAESVTQLNNTDLQVIRLVVSENNKQLKVEEF